MYHSVLNKSIDTQRVTAFFLPRPKSKRWNATGTFRRRLNGGMINITNLWIFGQPQIFVFLKEMGSHKQKFGLQFPVVKYQTIKRPQKKKTYNLVKLCLSFVALLTLFFKRRKNLEQVVRHHSLVLKENALTWRLQAPYHTRCSSLFGPEYAPDLLQL